VGGLLLGEGESIEWARLGNPSMEGRVVCMLELLVEVRDARPWLAWSCSRNYQERSGRGWGGVFVLEPGGGMKVQRESHVATGGGMGRKKR
jgi:hypothetical protein